MTEQKSRTAEGLMKLARWTYGLGGEHRARFDVVADKLITVMAEAGCSRENIMKEMNIFLDCYFAVRYEEKMKEIFDKPIVH